MKTTFLNDRSEYGYNLEKILNFYNIEFDTEISADTRYLLANASCVNISNIPDSISRLFLYKPLENNNIIPKSTSVRISNSHRKICAEFSGLSFPAPGHILSKLEGEGLIFCENNPVFNITRRGEQEIYTHEGNLIDLDLEIDDKFHIKDFFLELIPPLMFINYAYKPTRSKCACLIIDDPTLKERYGFLNFRKLLHVMDTIDFVSTIAFIPWNYTRTKKEISCLFKERADRLSLCIHGCDHTQGEFANHDLSILELKAKTALARMVEHERLTGIPFAPIMVFPQGMFSTNAMLALKEHNFLAAVNTEPNPIDIKTALTVTDFLGLYISKYHEHPLFIRRKPEYLEDFAFDIFQGRPALLVAHHYDINDQLFDFITKINSLNEIKWGSLEGIVDNYCSNYKRKSFMYEDINLNAFNVNGIKQSIKVYARRRASEFRDNYIRRGWIFSKFARALFNRIT